MTRKLLFMGGVLLLLVASNCTYFAPPIRVQGTAADLAQLSGEWSGEYVGDHNHRRRGSISFALVPGDAQARGDVLMIPEGLDRPYERYREPSSMRDEPAYRTTVLTIQFVTIDRDTVQGVLDPYWDPDRRTGASATFYGRLTDDVIQGRFTTTYANGSAETGGWWKVVRNRQATQY
jgi:hypothetical protein